MLTILFGEKVGRITIEITANPAGRGQQARRDTAQRLREAVIRGEVAPGHRLVEQELADRFGVTRSSVRAAIDVLVAEGLLERVPNRGARVRGLAVDEAVELLECRMALEGLLARKAAQRADAGRLAPIRAELTGMRRALVASDLLAFAAAYERVFGLLHELAAQGAASELTGQLQARLARHEFQLTLRPGRPQAALDELDELVEAVAARQPGTAERLARAHVQAAIAALAGETSD